MIVFRKNILTWSETFIADQGFYLPNYNALYCGFLNDDSGRELLKNSKTYVLGDYAISPIISKFLFRLGFLEAHWLDALKKSSPSVIHAHFLNDGIDAIALKKKLKIPLLTTLHGHDITKKEKRKLFRKDRAYFYKHVDKIIAVSDYIYSQALANGCPKEKLVKHSIGIDLQKFETVKSEASSPQLLFVGRLVEKKGCIYLLNALSQLQLKYPDISLIIVGDGPLKSSLQLKVKAEKLNVEFVGKQSPEQIRDRLSSAWVFTAPSITAENGDAEGLGMVFLEAQALKTPVVSFRSGGVVEAIEEGVTGLLSDEKDVPGLIENIEYFIDNADVRQLFGEKGRLRVEEKFNIKVQCKLLESIYDSVR